MSKNVMVVMVLLLCIATAHAALVDNVVVRDDVIGSDVRERITISLENNTLPNITLRLPAGATNIAVDGIATNTMSNGSVTLLLACTSCTSTIAYTLPGIIQTERNDEYSISRTLNLPQRPQVLTYEVSLEPGFLLVSGGAEPSVVPTPTALRTDGEHIIVVWTQEHPELPARYYVRFVGPERLENGAIMRELSEWIVWVILAVGLAVGSAAGVMIERSWGQRFKETDLPYVPASLLSPDERALITALDSHGKPIGQKDIGKHLGWSKSKVSAIMTALEHKKIVAREKVGRNYTVSLMKSIKE